MLMMVPGQPCFGLKSSTRRPATGRDRRTKILAALTTAPASRFGAAARTGRLATGLDADIAVLEGDPAQDIRALASLRATLRGGRVIYRQLS